MAAENTDQKIAQNHLEKETFRNIFVERLMFVGFNIYSHCAAEHEKVMKTIFRYRALFRRDPGRSTTRPGRSTGTSGCPPGRTSPSTSTRPSPHPTSPSLRSVNKTGDHGESGVWFWACKCPYMRSWRLVYPPGFSEVEASEATLTATP